MYSKVYSGLFFIVMPLAERPGENQGKKSEHLALLICDYLRRANLARATALSEHFPGH